MNRFRAAASGTIVALLIAGCGPASGTDGTASEPESTPAVTSSPAESEDGGSLPSFAPGAGELDEILPDEVGGITLQYQFAEGQGVMGSEGVTPEVQDFLDQVGASADDIRSAIGIGFDQASGGVISIFAIQVSGADEDMLRDEFQQVMEEDADSVFTEVTVGGKDVLAFTSGTAGEAPDGYMYVHDDVLFLVAGSTPELSEEALSLLP